METSATFRQRSAGGALKAAPALVFAGELHFLKELLPKSIFGFANKCIVDGKY
jgi:hypothetical protein